LAEPEPGPTGLVGPEQDAVSEVERDETREGFAAALAGWGLTPAQVADTLEATDFALGMVELRPPDGGKSPGIALVVADRRDPELRALFAWRAEASDEDYAAAWEVEEEPLTRVVLGPDEQALLRFAIRVRSPFALERRYLFAVGAVAPVLKKLQVAGTGLFLVPAKVIERETAREGTPADFDVLSSSVRVGTVERAIPSIDEALAHVGSPRESTTMRPMNRAERRAEARSAKKRRP
jgi:hypothetical protein